jgi:predicted RNase H-like HicB family nuclease
MFINKESSKVYIVEVSDLLGCMADGQLMEALSRMFR